MKTIIYFLGTTAVMLAAILSIHGNIPLKKATATTEKGFAVMELFTSQGCSSCPPADKVLGKFVDEGNDHVIALSFHVDYWNYIGWKDPYSKSLYSDRQRIYAQRLNASVYTPQLVINGKYEVVGSKEKTIREMVDAELKTDTPTKIDIASATVNDGQLIVKYDCKGSAGNYLNVALVKKKTLTNVGRGENGGRKLTNYNIVVDFNSKPLTKNAGEVSFSFDKNKILSEYSVIAYLQNQQVGKVLAAAKTEIQ